MNLILSALITVSFASFASADCRKNINAETKTVQLSNEDLQNGNGELTTESCIDLFVAIAKTEVLPEINGSVAAVEMRNKIENESTMDMVMYIFDQAPAKKTRLELGWNLEADPEGMNTIRALLTPKANYGLR